MLELKEGCFVTRCDLLSEQYSIDGSVITANVNTSKILDVFKDFISMQEAPVFFILELPTNKNDEDKLRASDTDPRHKDIYYIDGLSADDALNILEIHGELLINDGLCQFGFGVHDNSAELMSNKYNVLTIWTNDTEKYGDFFVAYDIPLVKRCYTAWNSFTQSTPGECTRIERNGINIFDLPDKLYGMGIYFAERREED